jgi:hypothetical protein
MASLSNINGIFDVHSTGAILFSTSHGTSGQILRSNGNAAPTWVAASTVIGGPYLPLTGGTLSGATATASGISFTVGGTLSGSTANFSGFTTSATGFGINYVSGATVPMVILANATTYGIFYREATPDYIEFKHNNVVQQSFDGSGNVTIAGALTGTSATFSGNVAAATFNGLAINTTGTNNVANQIVRTEANGYVNFGWINSISGATTSTITRITASNDAYLRYVTPATFRTQITDPYYAPAGTVSGVTSVATGNGLTGGTITSTGTLTMSGTYSGSMQFSGAHGSSQVGCQLPAANNGANTGVVNLRMWCSEPGVTWDWAGFGYNVTNNNGSPSGFGRLNTAFGQAYQRYSSSGNMYFYNTNTAGARVTTLTLSSNGQATFGYTVTAPTFVGALTGNATTASSAAQVTINYNNNSNANYQMLWGSGNNVYGTAGVVVNALSNTVTATTFSGSLSGNASTSTTFNTGRTNYKGVTDAAVIGQMMWKNYGNNHTIFDASSGTSPQGNVISNTNSINAWGATYPTLMGWNGSSTYGVRVDSARVADSATAASNVGGLTPSMIVSGGSGRKSTRVYSFAGTSEPSGFYFGSNIANNPPTTDWVNYIQSAGDLWTSGNNYSFQLTHAFHSDNFWVSRTTNGSQSTARLVLDGGGSSQTKSGALASGTSMTAPIYYDTNTTYYGDFASTSNINALTLVGTLSGQNAYFNQDVGIGFNSGNIGGKLNVQINSANGIGIKNNLNGKSGAQGLLQYTSASYASGGYNMVFQAVPPSGTDQNMLLCYLNGNIVNRFNSYGQYSDRKLKENIVDTTPKLEDVKKIRIRNFNFKDDPYKQIGVIAQEFEEVFPGLVEDKEVPDQDETTKTVKYSVLVPILVKAIQELEVRVKELENK